MNRPATSSVEVDIFGATYHVRGDKDPEHLQALADLVDARMREVATHTATVDTTKIAILAALNIAEELFQKSGGGGQKKLAERFVGLAEELEEALAEHREGA